MIKNYTSTVPATRSVAYIEHRLVKFGARNIVKSYDSNGTLSGLCFVIEPHGTGQLTFSVPARTKEVERRLYSEVRRPRPETKKKISEQAERTSWKLLSDWVEIQLSLVELGQVEFMEVFLPYAVTGMSESGVPQTFYEKIKNSSFKLLEYKQPK